MLCRACRHELAMPADGRLPPWCPGCGADLQLADRPAELPPSDDEPGAGGRIAMAFHKVRRRPASAPPVEAVPEVEEPESAGVVAADPPPIVPSAVRTEPPLPEPAAAPEPAPAVPRTPFRDAELRYRLVLLGSGVILAVNFVLGLVGVLGPGSAGLVGAMLAAVAATAYVATFRTGPDLGEGRPLALAALGAAVVAVPLWLAPKLLAWAVGWSANPAVGRDVLGPGDTVRVYFSSVPVRSLKGYWNGTNPSGQVLAGETDAPLGRPVVWSSGLHGWSVTFSPRIHVRPGEETTTPRPFATVRLPADPALAHRGVRLRVEMTMTYPVQDGSTSYKNRDVKLAETVPLRLAAPGAAARQATWALWGSLGGTLASLLGGYGLVHLAAARGRAEPVTV